MLRRLTAIVCISPICTDLSKVSPNRIFTPEMAKYFILLLSLMKVISSNRIYAGPLNSYSIELSPSMHDSQEPGLSPNDIENDIEVEVVEPEAVEPQEQKIETYPDTLGDSLLFEENTQKIIKRTSVQPYKYGGSLLLDKLSKRIGLFVEYKYALVGLELGVSWFKFSYNQDKASLKKVSQDFIVSYQSLAIPVIFKIYPGVDRQFAIRFGTQACYILGGKTYVYADESTYANFPWLDPKKRVNSWEFVMVFGLDYETDWGIIFGIDIVDELDPLLRKYKQQKIITAFMFHAGFNVGAAFY